MFVFSLRGEKLKKGIILALTVAVIAIASVIYIQSSQRIEPASVKNGISLKAATSEERIAFLSQFGWEVSPDPLEVREIIVPYEFDDTYTGYNEIQKKQNMDLSDYKGIRVKRWTYEILNYPQRENSDGIIRANMLIYDGRVIGGDICSIELDGFMHTFSFPEAEQAETTRKESAEAG